MGRLENGEKERNIDQYCSYCNLLQFVQITNQYLSFLSSHSLLGVLKGADIEPNVAARRSCANVIIYRSLQGLSQVYNLPLFFVVFSSFFFHHRR